MDDIGSIDPHWLWIALGLVLGILEMLVPGVYLIWLALAAIVTGLLAYGLDLGVPTQVMIFAFVSLIAAFSARRFMRDQPIESADPMLNQRGAQIIGESVLVTQKFEGGTGRVKHGDSEWLARGPDLDVGDRVRITGSEGAILIVQEQSSGGGSSASDMVPIDD
ncbi:MAG: NfeD family protein [Erythrobacter sp.]